MDWVKGYTDSDGKTCTLWQMVKTEPEWAANMIREGEKAVDELADLKVSEVIYKMHLAQKDMALAANAKHCDELRKERDEWKEKTHDRYWQQVNKLTADLIAAQSRIAEAEGEVERLRVLLSTRVEAQRLDDANADIERLKVDCECLRIQVVDRGESFKMVSGENERLRVSMESATNMLRGMTLDPAIPDHAKDAMWHRIAELEAAEAVRP